MNVKKGGRCKVNFFVLVLFQINCHRCLPSLWLETNERYNEKVLKWFNINMKEDFFFGGGLFFVLYSTLLHLPPLKFRCADGCWDRTQDRCNELLPLGQISSERRLKVRNEQILQLMRGGWGGGALLIPRSRRAGVEGSPLTLTSHIHFLHNTQEARE